MLGHRMSENFTAVTVKGYGLVGCKLSGPCNGLPPTVPTHSTSRMWSDEQPTALTTL
jgi:hypothetical protein